MAPGKGSSPRSAVPFLGAYRTFRTTRVALQQSPIRSGSEPSGKHWMRGCQRNRRLGEVIHFCSNKFCPLLLSPLQHIFHQTDAVAAVGVPAFGFFWQHPPRDGQPHAVEDYGDYQDVDVGFAELPVRAKTLLASQ